MVQTIGTYLILAGEKKVILKKPHVLCRIFFGIRVLASPQAWAESRISFDDPMFHSYYILAGASKYFEARGKGIFQGDVWALNNTAGDLSYTVTEILI